MIPQQISAGLLLLFLAAGTVTTHAATRIWTGAVSPFWSNPANWLHGQRPLPGDSIEFPEEAPIREVYNDLELDFSVGDITIKGRNYILQGNRISLEGDLTSMPSNSTNRIMLDAHLYAPLTISNHGYFNQLELGGHLRLWYDPLVLETSSSIKITNYLMDTNNLGVIQRGAGTVSFEGNGFLVGAMIVETGDLLLSGSPNRMRIVGGP
ncbi:MAG TPA: hypothetical protein VLD18_04510, partial [Verrucomicrobiae bacterium]|nr:hypothetical protein [Verrucomicrobiae bacterium]